MTEDPLAWLDEPEPVAIERARDARVEVVRQVEDELLVESRAIVSGAMAFADILPGATEPPEEWVRELGADAAFKKLRLAQFGSLSSADAPIGLRIASDTLKSVIAAKAKRDVGATAEVHLEVVQLTLVKKEYNILDVTGTASGPQGRRR